MSDKQLSNKKKLLYTILFLWACMFAWHTYIHMMFPFWKIELRNYEFLASLPNDCQWNCQKTDRYRDMRDTCIIKKIHYTTDVKWKETPVSIESQTVQEWVSEKWSTVYIMLPSSHTPFQETCYDFSEKSFQ